METKASSQHTRGSRGPACTARTARLRADFSVFKSPERSVSVPASVPAPERIATPTAEGEMQGPRVLRALCDENALGSAGRTVLSSHRRHEQVMPLCATRMGPGLALVCLLPPATSAFPSTLTAARPECRVSLD